MEWYEWESLESFNTWHDNIKKILGLPKFSTNMATGEIDETAAKTENYTSFIEVNEKIIALVDDEYSLGLTKTLLRPIPKTNHDD